jgi:single-stranded-DNA-specific exonuclease
VEAPPKRWKKRPQLKPDQITALSAALVEHHLSPLLLQLLYNRGLVHPQWLADTAPDGAAARMKTAVAAFLQPTTTPLPNPFSIAGMDAAVDRVARAIPGETIAIYGDYDADGVTSTTLLTQALKAWGAKVIIHVPHRKREGYGLNMEALDSLADRGVTLVITVDCGISNRKEVEHGKARGMDLIVTDHHELPTELPDTILLNPKQAGESDPFYWLTGVGVAHQLVRALVERLGKPPGLRNNELLELVAIGTVADVAPLTGANRTLVAHGLAALRATRRPGLLALCRMASIEPANITAHHIGFMIGPRLNAAGRLDDAKPAYELLLTTKAERAAALAEQIEGENRNRQEITRRIVDEARALVADLEQETPVIMLRDPTWEVGVVGLAAGRLCDEFGRPVFLLTDEGTQSRGSARSTRHFDLHKMLTECHDLLARYGGHAAAAGLTIDNEKWEAFYEQMQEIALNEVDDESQMAGELYAEAELPLNRANIETLAELQALEPYGHGNSRPLFVARNVRVVESRANGKDGRTLVVTLAPADGAGPPVRAVGFGMAPDWQPKLAADSRVDIMFQLKLDTWQGQQRVEMELKGLRLAKEG